MIIEIDDWKFDVDIAATMEYSAAEAADHCTCAYCRNFYAAVDEVCPELRPFLAQFGLDIEAPEELMPYDVGKEMSYDGDYAIRGKILNEGKCAIQIGDVYIHPETDSQISHSLLEPCFYLFLDSVVLPWVLDEPMEDVVSPANEPSFLQKMWNKLLNRQPKDEFPT